MICLMQAIIFRSFILSFIHYVDMSNVTKFAYDALGDNQEVAKNWTLNCYP